MGIDSRAKRAVDKTVPSDARAGYSRTQRTPVVVDTHAAMAAMTVAAPALAARSVVTRLVSAHRARADVSVASSVA